MLILDKEGLSQRPGEKGHVKYFGVQASDGLT